MAFSNTNKQIRNCRQIVFRKAFIKRRLNTTGQFESDWFEITNDVKRWGAVKIDTDSTRPGRFRFSSASIGVANDLGSYNDQSDNNSYWYGYLDRQRTLFKIEAGFIHETLTSSGIWRRHEHPGAGTWDVGIWDSHEWDDGSNVVFTGVLAGDMNLSDHNDITLNVKPLVQIFSDFSAKNLTGFTSTGLTASEFMTMLRDQTDGSGSFIFRPFFGDTTTNWNITTTTANYSSLNTSSAAQVRDSSVWNLIEKLAEAEGFVAYVSKDGIFNFKDNSTNTITAAFYFNGVGTFNSEYGHTIKSVDQFGPQVSKFYNRVSVKFSSSETSTSYEIRETTMGVSAVNLSWVYGQKSFDVENILINSSTTAGTLAQSLYDDLSSLRREIDFTTSFVPHLDIFDRIAISYDTSEKGTTQNYWDLADWAHDTNTTSSDLVWDSSKGQIISLLNREFRFLSINIDLDKFECKFKAREL